MKMGNKRNRAGLFLVAVLLMGAMMLFSGCDKQGDTKEKLTFTTEYQAVLLNNGQYFFGKMEKAGSAYPILRDVYYVRQQMNPETKEMRSTIFKRSMEPFGPDMMYINANSIALIEPVAPDSKLEQQLCFLPLKRPDMNRVNCINV